MYKNNNVFGDADVCRLYAKRSTIVYSEYKTHKLTYAHTHTLCPRTRIHFQNKQCAIKNDRSRLQAPVIHANTLHSLYRYMLHVQALIEIQKRTNENSTANGKNEMITGKSNKRHNCNKLFADLSTIIMFVRLVVAFDTQTYTSSRLLARLICLSFYLFAIYTRP